MSFWTIARKDLLLLARDSRALILLVALPLVFITIIGLTTGKLLGWKSENQVLKIGIVDELDYAAIEDDVSRREARNIVHKIVNGLRNSPSRRIAMIQRKEDYQRMLDEEDLDAVLVVGPRFFQRVQAIDVEDVLGGKSSQLQGGLGALDMQLHTNLVRESSTRGIIEELLFDHTVRAIAPYVFCWKFQSGDFRVSARKRVHCRPLETEIVELQPAPAAESDASGGDERVYQDLIPSYTVLFVFFLVNIMARSFLLERDLGTLRRLRIAPLRGPDLILGKTLPFLIVSLVQTALLFLAGKLLFGMSWGTRPWMLLPVIFATSLAATGLGLVVATLVRSDSQVSAYANIVVISMAGISGCFMPRDWLPLPMQTISLLTPHAWALMSYEQLLKRNVPDLTVVWQDCGVLALFAAAFFAFGCWRFRRYD